MTRPRARENTNLVVRGVLYPAEADDDGRALAAYLTTDQDEEYLIEPYEKGNDLIDFIDRYVEVSGVLNNDDGEYSVTVKAFRLLDDEGDDPYE